MSGQQLRGLPVLWGNAVNGGDRGSRAGRGATMVAMQAVARPASGRVITIVVAVVAVVWLVGLTEQYGFDTGLRVLPWLGLGVWACWATLWRPRVEFDDSGVTLVNVFRTIRLPWPSIQLVDTKWMLTLVTVYGTFRAWAAPAPGARATVRADKSQLRNLPESTGVDGGVRPGDVPSSQSGGAAWAIRRHWEELRDAGYLDDPRQEYERAPITWHISVIASGLAMLILGIAALIV